MISKNVLGSKKYFGISKNVLGYQKMVKFLILLKQSGATLGLINVHDGSNVYRRTYPFTSPFTRPPPHIKVNLSHQVPHGSLGSRSIYHEGFHIFQVGFLQNIKALREEKNFSLQSTLNHALTQRTEGEREIK